MVVLTMRLVMLHLLLILHLAPGLLCFCSLLGKSQNSQRGHNGSPNLTLNYLLLLKLCTIDGHQFSP